MLMWQLTWRGQNSGPICHTRVDVRARVSACVCARVRVCVINENKHPFRHFCLLINRTLLMHLLDYNNFCHWGLFYFVLMRK